jgi:catechol 2,3-dioxygenase-like lactoylglutathione lyase family enzyme
MSLPDIPLRKIDHVRFFVGNARQSAFFYRNAFGFDVVAYAGLETKVKHEAAYVLKQGGITFVLAFQLISLGVVAAQAKRYFEELYHLGTSVRRRVDRIETSLTVAGGEPAERPYLSDRLDIAAKKADQEDSYLPLKTKENRIGRKLANKALHRLPVLFIFRRIQIDYPLGIPP